MSVDMKNQPNYIAITINIAIDNNGDFKQVAPAEL